MAVSSRLFQLWNDNLVLSPYREHGGTDRQDGDRLTIKWSDSPFSLVNIEARGKLLCRCCLTDCDEFQAL